MDAADAWLARAPVVAALLLAGLAAYLAPSLMDPFRGAWRRITPRLPERWRREPGPNSLFWRDATLAMLLGALALVSLTAVDYGYNVDESFQGQHGRDVFDWYADALSGQRRSFRSEIPVMNYYGGFFELLAEASTRISPLHATTTRHLFTAWFALLSLLGSYLLGCTLASRAVGCIAVVLLLVWPRYYGHFFSNPKDIPFATCMLLALLAVCRALPGLPRLRVGQVLAVGGAAGAAMGVRIGGILALGSFALALAWWLSSEILRRRAGGERPSVADLARLVLSAASVLCVAWGVMLAFWPWAQEAPISGPIDAIRYFGDIVGRQQVNFPVFFEGRYFLLSDTPRHFTLEWLAISLPEVALLLLLVILPEAFRRLAAPRAWPDARAMGWILTVVAFGLPLATTVNHGIIQYDSIRHFLFVIPPLALLLSGALVASFTRPGSLRWKTGLAVAGALLLGTSVWDTWRLHPYQYTYFNRSLTGGLRLASQAYETDYLGLGYREAVRWAVANYQPPRGLPVRISICKGWHASLADALENAGAPPERFRPVPPHAPADLAVAGTRNDCHKRFLGETLTTVGRLGVPFVHVIELAR